MMEAVKHFSARNLAVAVYKDRAALGEAAGKDAAVLLKELLARQAHVNMMFAAAPSQAEMLESLLADPDIDWRRVNAFHMDEYIGLDPDAPQGFGNYLRARVFARVPMHQVHYLRAGLAPDEAEAEAARYAAVLADSPLDICLMGVGENGHLAFNDPPVADFNDPATVKVVRLDEACKLQQVNDGAFASVGQVPPLALTVTVPALMSARSIFCAVPGASKAEAVRNMLEGAVTPDCPASILVTHPDARLYLDADSARLIL